MAPLLLSATKIVSISDIVRISFSVNMPKKLSKTDTKKLTESPFSVSMPKKLLIKKKLSKTDIENRMSVPMKSFDAFGIRKGEHFKEIGVTDIHGERRRFRCSTRKTGLHPKPVLSSGWTAFAKERGLRKGDEVTIFVMDDINGAEDLEFQIQARRKMELFGKVFWTDPL